MQSMHQLVYAASSGMDPCIILVIAPKRGLVWRDWSNLESVRSMNRIMCERGDIEEGSVELGCAGFLHSASSEIYSDLDLSVYDVPQWCNRTGMHNLDQRELHWHIRNGAKVHEPMEPEEWREWVEE